MGMNKFIKPLAIVAAGLFIVGICAVAYEFITLPEAIMESTPVVDLSAKSQMQPAINSAFLITGICLTLGLAAIFLQILVISKQASNVVSQQQATEEAKPSAVRLNEEDEELHDVSALDADIVSEIQQIASDKKTKPNQKLELALRKICNTLEASQGAVYVCLDKADKKLVELRAGYALMKGDSEVVQYEFGEGLPGQVAKEGKLVNIDQVPNGYIKVLSGLGNASPTHLLLCPVKAGDNIKGVVELASFNKYNRHQVEIVKQAFELMGKVFEESSKQNAANPEAADEAELVANVK